MWRLVIRLASLELRVAQPLWFIRPVPCEGMKLTHCWLLGDKERGEKKKNEFQTELIVLREDKRKCDGSFQMTHNYLPLVSEYGYNMTMY